MMSPPPLISVKPALTPGFTLIELAIVLVIIGLIVGGVLVGRDLIGAAALRAQISQIEKYNTAANTFRAKYNYLPGDIPNPPAVGLGFAARGTLHGEGDGNDIIEGENGGWCEMGETTLFWVDLSQAGLIDGSFNTATATTVYAAVTGTTLNAWLPQAKLGQGNYVYVWSGGWRERWTGTQSLYGDGLNYFGISAVTEILGTSLGQIFLSPGLTVQQAFSIDTKIDDGLPQSGNVMATYPNDAVGSWAAGGGVQGAWQYGANNAEAPTITATTGSATTCYDNGGVGGATQQYSMGQSGGTGINCALSFKFQ